MIGRQRRGIVAANLRIWSNHRTRNVGAPGAGLSARERAYHLRDEARIRRNNREAVRRYQDRNRERINEARRLKRAAAKASSAGAIRDVSALVL